MTDATKVRAGPLRLALESLEKRMIHEALVATRGRMVGAARMLGITVRIMGLRMRKYGLSVRAYRDAPRGGDGPAPRAPRGMTDYRRMA